MPYRTLLLDADNTILDFFKCEKVALRSCLIHRGLPSDDETVAIYSAINDNQWKRLERREISRQEVLVGRFRIFFDRLGYDGNPEEMQDEYTEALAGQNFLMEGALDVCRSLSGEYDLFIVTNGNSYNQHKRIDSSPVRPYLLDVFISEELGADKPSQAYFEEVANRIRTRTGRFEKDEVLLVGDSLSSDIAGGNRFGIDTCFLSYGRTDCPGFPEYRSTYTIHDIRELPDLLKVCKDYADGTVD